jgi:hypothetical protein
MTDEDANKLCVNPATHYMLIQVRLFNCDHGRGYIKDDPATRIQSPEGGTYCGERKRQEEREGSTNMIGPGNLPNRNAIIIKGR